MMTLIQITFNNKLYSCSKEQQHCELSIENIIGSTGDPQNQIQRRCHFQYAEKTQANKLAVSKGERTLNPNYIYL